MADTDVQKLDSGYAGRRTVAVHWFTYVVNKDILKSLLQIGADDNVGWMDGC